MNDPEPKRDSSHILLMVFGALAGLGGGLALVFWNGVLKPAPPSALTAEEETAAATAPAPNNADNGRASETELHRARHEQLIDLHIVYVGNWLAHAKARKGLETQALGLFARMQAFMDSIRRAKSIQELQARQDDAKKLQADGNELKAKLDSLRIKSRAALEAATANAMQIEEVAKRLGEAAPAKEDAATAKTRARRAEVLTDQIRLIDDLRTIDNSIDDIESTSASISARLAFLLVRMKLPPAGQSQVEVESQIKEIAKKEAAECDAALAKLIKRAQEMGIRYALVQNQLAATLGELQQLTKELRPAAPDGAPAPRDRITASTPTSR